LIENLDAIPSFASYVGNIGLIIYLIATRKNRSAQASKIRAEASKIEIEAKKTNIEAEIELNKQALKIVASMQLEISRLQGVIDDLGVRVRHLEEEGAHKEKKIIELKNKISSLSGKCPQCQNEIRDQTEN